MVLYKNINGNSNILAYEIALESILVKFGDGSIYHYTYSSTGKDDIEYMKELAVKGFGLNSFISRIVRKRFDAKLA